MRGAQQNKLKRRECAFETYLLLMPFVRAEKGAPSEQWLPLRAWRKLKPGPCHPFNRVTVFMIRMEAQSGRTLSAQEKDIVRCSESGCDPEAKHKCSSICGPREPIPLIPAKILPSSPLPAAQAVLDRCVFVGSVVHVRRRKAPTSLSIPDLRLKFN